MKKQIYFFFLISNQILCQSTIIGSQNWMVNNLDVSVFRNGDSLMNAESAESWKFAGENKIPAWCYTGGGGAYCGKLYNWYAVNDPRGIAPHGYHVPTAKDWQILIDYLGEGQAGEKMKNIADWPIDSSEIYAQCENCSIWSLEYRRKNICSICNNTQVVPVPLDVYADNYDNSIGFNAMPCGSRGSDGVFGGIGEYGLWWSSTMGKNGEAMHVFLPYNFDYLGRSFCDGSVGFSVRCLQDVFNETEKELVRIDYELPVGSVIVEGYNQMENKIEYDFDQDQIEDLVLELIDADGNDQVFFFLSTLWIEEQRYLTFPCEFMSTEIKLSNGELEIILNENRAGSKYCFKYFPELANMRLIYFVTEYIGDAYDYNAGASYKFFDLLSGEFFDLLSGELHENEMSGRVKNIPIITLSNFEEYSEFLYNIRF